MEHEKIKGLISTYHDGELNEEQKKVLEKHLEQCLDCQKEFEKMRKFEEVMGKMELKKPNEEVWKIYWGSVYNRLERRIGWILLSIGAMIFLFFGGYKMVEGIIHDPSTPLFIKAGILAVIAGVVVLLVSVLRERLYVRKRERYKEIEK